MATIKGLNKLFREQNLATTLVKGKGYFYFIPDVETLDTYSVWINSLNEYTIADWVREAELSLNKREVQNYYDPQKINEQIQKELTFYRLTDALGNKKVTVVDDPTNNGCIGGYDKDGNYHQYDSYELWHAYDWAEKLGMKLESGTMKLDISDSIFS